MQCSRKVWHGKTAESKLNISILYNNVHVFCKDSIFSNIIFLMMWRFQSPDVLLVSLEFLVLKAIRIIYSF